VLVLQVVKDLSSEASRWALLSCGGVGRNERAKSGAGWRPSGGRHDLYGVRLVLRTRTSG